MPRIKWLTGYGQYKEGQEFEVSNIDTLKRHLSAGRIEVVKAKPETATSAKVETATVKAETTALKEPRHIPKKKTGK